MRNYICEKVIEKLKGEMHKYMLKLHDQKLYGMLAVIDMQCKSV